MLYKPSSPTLLFCVLISLLILPVLTIGQTRRVATLVQHDTLPRMHKTQADENNKRLQVNSINQRVTTTYITPDTPRSSDIKKSFVKICPLTILGADKTFWQQNLRINKLTPKVKHVIVVYFKIKNNTANSVSGYIQPSINEVDYSSASISISRLQANAEFSGSIKIINPSPPCYDNYLQLTFFKVDTFSKKGINSNNVNSNNYKNTYDIRVTEQSSDVTHLNLVDITIDKDQDFVDDKFEDYLLTTFRPYFKFTLQDGPEQYRPCDAFYYIRNSTIGGNHQSAVGSTDYCPPFPGFDQKRLASDPNSLLTVGNPGKPPVDLWADHEKATTHLQPSSAVIHGNEWNEILAKKNVGLYGHVVPVVINSLAEYSPGKIFACTGSATAKLYYKVEYWQFFGYNYPHQHIIGLKIADHEADWSTVQLLIEPITLRIVSVFYYAHGGETRFDILPSMKPVTFNDMGGLPIIQYNGVNISQPSNQNISSEGNGYNTRNDRRVRFWKEPGTTSYTHPVVYIENGSHEFWPTEDGVYGVKVAGSFYYAPLHNGDDNYHSYLTETPPNLGELEHPLDETQEANVILRYAGIWGCYNFSNSNPPGPTFHTEWTYPFNSTIFKDIAYALEN